MSGEARPEQSGRGGRATFPVLAWLPTYRRDWLRGDLIAGVTSWAVVVPQAVAYAQIAGLPPQAALYALPAAMVGYALVGTSRQLIVGPTSSTAIVSASSVAPLAGGDMASFAALSAALVVAGLTVVTGLVLTPVFRLLPQAALAAIVINAVLGFLRFDELRRFARLRRDSFFGAF